MGSKKKSQPQPQPQPQPKRKFAVQVYMLDGRLDFESETIVEHHTNPETKMRYFLDDDGSVQEYPLNSFSFRVKELK